MRFPDPLIEGVLVSRYKRFFADVRLPDGRTVTAHCPNSGTMRGCLEPGARAWVSPASRPGRTLAFTLELLEHEGALVLVNTARPNRLAEEAIAVGRIPELTGYPDLRREVRYEARSRVDLLLEGPAGRCWVEVKNVTMSLGGGLCRFPDAVTTRGTRHLQALGARVAAGERAVLLFCVGRSDGRRVEPADEVDPTYGHALRTAAAAGVEILAYGCAISPADVVLGGRLPVALRSGSLVRGHPAA